MTKLRIRKATLDDYEFIRDQFININYHWWFYPSPAYEPIEDPNKSTSSRTLDFSDEELLEAYENDIKNFRSIFENDFEKYFVIEYLDQKIGYINLRTTSKKSLKRLLEWALLTKYQKEDFEKEILLYFKNHFLKNKQIQVCVPPHSLGHDFFVAVGFKPQSCNCFLYSEW